MFRDNKINQMKTLIHCNINDIFFGSFRSREWICRCTHLEATLLVLDYPLTINWWASPGEAVSSLLWRNYTWNIRALRWTLKGYPLPMSLCWGGKRLGEEERTQIERTNKNTRIYVENSNRKKPRSRMQIDYVWERLQKEKTEPYSRSEFTMAYIRS